MSKNVVSKFVILPNGARLRPFMIQGINPTDKGVSITSSDGTMLGFVEVDDPKKKDQVMELLDNCSTLGKKFEQPDWLFLTQGGGEQ